MRGKLAVEVLCGARNGRHRQLVARLWWTPPPEMLLLNTSETVQDKLPRNLRAKAHIQCAKCDGNKGHVLWPDVSRFLRKPFDDFERTGEKQTITLPR